MNIFTYGSLMFSEVWNKVVQGNYYSSSATLQGYRRFCIRNESYPGLRKANSYDKVNGIVYHDIDNQDLMRLDAFEGGCYERLPVTVDLGNSKIKSHVYLIRDQYLFLATEKQWDPEDFYKKSIGDFVATYTGF
jgi:gamma-glutamylcyclotransferase (GGCT)/AIG2-like uncharacterized protein YtfP